MVSYHMSAWSSLLKDSLIKKLGSSNMWCYICLLLSILVVVEANQLDSECQRKWQEFRLQYQRDYRTAEEEGVRLEYFCANYQWIRDRNRRLGREQLQVNGLTDRSPAELAQLTFSNGAQLSASLRAELGTQPFEQDTSKSKNGSSLPASLDWSTDPTIVGPVHDQGNCGSCWALTVLGLIEARQHYKWPGEQVVSLSVQQVLDCDRHSRGCLGGMPGQAFEYIRSAGGLESEADYPYVSGKTGQTQECSFNASRISKSSRNPGRLWYDYKREGDELFLQRMLAENEPIGLLYHVGQDFLFTGEGVVYDETCPENPIPNHALLLVGYGTTEQGEQYWKVKNTWGPDWGVGGYGFVARNRNNNCGVASNPYMLRP